MVGRVHVEMLVECFDYWNTYEVPFVVGGTASSLA